MPLLAVLATGAAAQTVVPDDWPLKPSGFSAGDRFRLMFVTSTTRDATSSSIGDYNSFVQTRAAAGHMSIRSHSAQFRALGSTAAVDARDNTSTTGTGVPIYWLGGTKVADDYADFYDGSWANPVGRDESGGAVGSSTRYWTGSDNDGTRAVIVEGVVSYELGSALGATRTSNQQGLNYNNNNTASTVSYGLLALSPLFEVGTSGASLSVSDGTVAESASPPLMRFTVRLSERVERTVRVRIRTRESSPPSASHGRDFAPIRYELAFLPGETEKHVWVFVMQDGRAEGAETFEVELLRASGAPVADAVGVGTITDGAMPAVTVSSPRLAVTEGGASALYSVAVSAPPGRGETVTVTATSDDAAAARVNGGASAVLRFTAGNWTVPQTVTVTARDDADMDDESVSIAHTVSGPAAWTGVTAPSVSVSVSDDEAPPGPPVAGFARVASAVAEDAGTGTVRVTLSSPPAAPLPLTYTVTGTATPGTDYTMLTGTVTVPAGATGADIAVAVTDDAMDEPDETVVLTLADGTGYTVGSGVHTLTVTDDDDPPPGVPAVSIAPASGSAVAEGGNAAFTLTAERAPAADLAVTVEVSDPPGSNFVAAAGEGERTVTIPAGQTTADFTVAIAPDSDDEPSGRVTATVAGGKGYPVGSPSSASVAVTDDDPTAVTLSGTATAISEDGGTKVLEVTIGRALVEGERLNVPVVLRGAARHWEDYRISCWTDYGVGCRYVGAPGGQVYFVGGPTATRMARLTVTTIDDRADEGTGETLTVSLGTPDGNLDGGASVSAPVSFEITDDDDPLPVVTIAGGAAVTEGGNAVFTVSVSPAPSADLPVWVEVSDAHASDFLARSDEGRRRVTVPSGQGSITLTLATQQDDLDEPDGTVRVALAAGAGYRRGAAASASVAVSDDDATTMPTLSIGDETLAEGAGDGRGLPPELSRMRFTIRLSAPQSHVVRVIATTRDSTPVSARAWHDYRRARLYAAFRPGQTEAHVWVLIVDDSHNEDPETFELVLSRPSGAAIGDGIAVATITNDDPMPAAWLSRFGRTVAEQALDGIAGRMAAPRSPGMQGSIAGQALSFDPAASDSPGSRGAGPGPGHAPGGTAGGTGALALADVAKAFGSHSGYTGAVGIGRDTAGFGSGFDGMQPQSRGMTGREALLGSNFSLTGEKDGSGGSIAFWGRAAQGSFDGREGTFSLDGAVTTGMLGADYARGKWLVGLALARSTGEGDYRDTGTAPRPGGHGCPEGAGPLCDDAVRAGDGGVEASLTAAIPYAALQASERLKLWGTAGYGNGEVTLKTATGASYSADTSWSMAAAGLRGDLLAPPAEGSGPALALTSDALWTRTSSEKTRDLAASESDATRLRLGLEGSYRMAIKGGGHPGSGSGASLTPRLEVGARHDGGDAETGFGIELGGGLKWVDPALGLSLDVSGRTLIAHEDDDLKDRGYAASLAFDPDPATKRGPSLSLRQDWGGRAQGGLDALFQPPTLDERNGSEAVSRWAMEAAYGFPAFGGRWTGSPHVGLGLATGARDYSVGWRLTPEAANAPDMSFGLRATRQETDTAEPEHTVGVEITARW